MDVDESAHDSVIYNMIVHGDLSEVYLRVEFDKNRQHALHRALSQHLGQQLCSSIHSCFRLSPLGGLGCLRLPSLRHGSNGGNSLPRARFCSPYLFLVPFSIKNKKK